MQNSQTDVELTSTLFRLVNRQRSRDDMRLRTNLTEWVSLISYYIREIRGPAKLSDIDLNFVADSAEVILHLKDSPIKAEQQLGGELAALLASYFMPLERTEEEQAGCFLETRDEVKKVAYKLATSIIPEDHELGCRYIREVETYFKV